MNGSCGVRGYMLRQDFSVDFQIEISEKVDAYRMVYDAAYQRRRAERMTLNAPSERAIPPSCETAVGRIEDALAVFENRYNDFFWSQGFQSAMTAGEDAWPQFPDWLEALEREMDERVEAILAELEGEELARGRRYFQLRREDIGGGGGYRYLHGYEFAFCILESTGRRMDRARLAAVYAWLGLAPAEE